MIKLLFISLIAVAAAAPESYEHNIVVSVVAKTNEQLQWLHQIREQHEVDFWSEPNKLNAEIDIRFTPHNGHLLKTMQDMGINGKLKIRDVQSLVEAQKARSELKTQPKNGLKLDHTKYRELEEIYQVLDEFAADSYLVTVKDSPHITSQGRRIKIVEISTDGGSTKPVIWIDCGIHAREWVSQATCQYIIDVLTSGGAEATKLLANHDFHLMPVTNPDGYKYTWTNSRFWRKNRHSYGMCVGTDPNRNFDSDFGGPGTSNSPCSDIYHGEYAFSEPESQAIRDEILSLGSRVKAFITLHSYSQYWMTPYGYTHSLPADYDEMYRVSGIGVNALTAVHGTKFVYGNIADVIYMAAGGSTDWAYDGASVLYPFALELRDTGNYGFLLPPSQIIPTGEETFAGIAAAVEAMH